MYIESVTVSFHVCCFVLRCVIKAHQKSFSHMHTESPSSVPSETGHVQQEIDANYANVSQLSKVSMETKLQRLCRSTLSCWLEENVLLGYRLQIK